MFTVCVLHGDAVPHPLATVVTDPLADADAYVVGEGCPHTELLTGTTYTSVAEAVDALVIDRVELVTACDACCRKVKATYATFPSARASQAIAKCRKHNGDVRKTDAGRSLKRWQREKWKDKITGKPCGHKGGPEYCRPSKKVSDKTPAMYRGKKLAQGIAAKQRGERATP